MSQIRFRNVAAVVAAVSLIIAVLALALAGEAARISAAASILVAGGTLLLALVTYRAVVEARNASLASQHALSRPLLVPTNPVRQDNLPNASERHLNIRNDGSGVALNVRGVLLPHAKRSPQVPPQLSMRFRFPLPANETKQTKFERGGTLFAWEDTIDGIPICVPERLAPEDGIPNTSDRRDRVVARLTLTCQDLFGNIHATVFDLTLNSQWVFVDSKQDISAGISELDRAKGSGSRQQ